MNHESFQGEVITKRETELSQEEKAFIDECADSLMEIREDKRAMDIFSVRETYSSEEEAEYYEEMASENFNKACDSLESMEYDLAERTLSIPAAKRLFVLKKAKEAYLEKVKDSRGVRKSTKYKKDDKRDAELNEEHAKSIFNRIFRLVIRLEKQSAEAAK